MSEIKSVLKKLWQQHWPILVIALLAVPPLLWWLKAGQVIMTVDFYFPINPTLALQKSLLTWDTSEITGSDLTNSLFIPRLVLFSISSLL
jgi:hypothetical protein